MKGRKLLQPIENIPNLQTKNLHEIEGLDTKAMKELPRFSVHSSNSDIHDIVHAQRARLGNYVCFFIAFSSNGIFQLNQS